MDYIDQSVNNISEANNNPILLEDNILISTFRKREKENDEINYEESSQDSERLGRLSQDFQQEVVSSPKIFKSRYEGSVGKNCSKATIHLFH